MTHAPNFASGADWTRDPLPVISGVYSAMVLAVVDPAAFCYDIEFRPLCL